MSCTYERWSKQAVIKRLIELRAENVRMQADFKDYLLLKRAVKRQTVTIMEQAEKIERLNKRVKYLIEGV